MTKEAAIVALCDLAFVRYAHMNAAEQRTFLEAVMCAGAEPEAGLAARMLAALDEAEARQGELFEVFQARAAGPRQTP